MDHRGFLLILDLLSLIFYYLQHIFLIPHAIGL